MSSFEVGYCSFKEYKAGTEDRVYEEELCVGGLYVVMFVLDANSVPPAAKYPARVNEIDDQHEEGYGVKFTIMDIDLQPEYDSTGTFRNGYWLPAHSNPIIVGNTPVISGYFKEEYAESDGEQDLQDMLNHEIEWQGVTGSRQPSYVL